MATIYPVGQLANGSIRYSDGSVKIAGSSATNPNYANYQPAMSQKNPIIPATPQDPLGKSYQQKYTVNTNQQKSPTNSGGSQPQQNNDSNNISYFAPQAPNPPSGPSDQELNDAYNPLFDYLNQAEASLRGDMPTYQNEVNANYNTSKQILNNGLNSGKATIDSQLNQGNKQRLDVISEAQRLYNELMMANNQRFGGASSAGQAASELQGRELQRGTFKANQQYQDLATELGNKKLELDQNFAVSLQQLEDKKMSSLNEINRQFQEKLLQINQMRANTASEKANRRLQALQDYRNNVYQVQLQNYNMQQQLQAYKAQSDIQLQNYAKQLEMSKQASGNSFNAFSSGLSTPSYSTVGQQQTTSTMTPTGQIGQQKTEDPTQAVGYMPPQTQNPLSWLNPNRQYTPAF